MVASAARASYAILAEPLSGPDSDTYHAAGIALSERGPLAEEVPGLPYWPAGYPLLVGAVYAVAGPRPSAVGIVQVLLLAIGTIALYRLADREFGPTVALLSVVLLSASPAILAASTQLMYEVPLAVLLVVGFDALSRARRGGPHQLAWAAAGALALGGATTIQPKALAAALPAVLWWAWPRRHVAGTALVLGALALAPALLAVRTYVVFGDFALSANVGVNLRIGLNDDATGRYGPAPDEECGLRGDRFATDRALVRCSAAWALDHPGRLPRLTAAKVLNFWSPLTGPAARDRGTWFHAFDPGRVLPAGARGSRAFEVATAVAQSAWTAGAVAAVALGAVVGLRRPERRGAVAVLLVWPVVAFLVVTIATFGDVRFRLPVAPHYTVLVALAIEALLRRRTSVRRAKGKASMDLSLARSHPR